MYVCVCVCVCVYIVSLSIYIYIYMKSKVFVGQYSGLSFFLCNSAYDKTRLRRKS